MFKMVSAKGVIITFLLVGLFAFCLINFSTQFSQDNNLNQSIIDAPAFSSLNSSLGDSLGGSQTVAETQKEGFEKETQSEQPGFLSLGSIRDAGKIFTGTTVVMFNILTGGFLADLGIPSVIFTVLGSILLITLIFLGWRVIKLGE